jgi:hypothetical protein
MLKKKGNLEITKRIIAHRMMPPELENGDASRAVISFVTPEGNLVRHPAELIQFGKAAGTSMGGNRHSGYDVRHQSNFVICLNKIGKVSNIHIFPKHDFSSQAPPTEVAEQELIEGKIDQNTGDITITGMPMGTRNNLLLEIFSKIDDCDMVEPGQQITPSCSVDSVAGNEFKLRVNIAPTQVVTTLSQVMKDNAAI